MRGPPSTAGFATSRAVQLLANALLASVWGLFAARHVASFLETDALLMLVFALSESVVVVLFLVREPASRVAADPMAWALGIAGTLAPMTFVPTHRVLFLPMTALTWIGAAILLGGLLSLNRSFGIVAAQRQLKTGGLYRVVRHPIYASYVLSFTGYLLGNWAWTNVAITVVALGLMLARLQHEERVLSEDPAYRAFVARTPYRLIPYVW